VLYCRVVHQNCFKIFGNNLANFWHFLNYMGYLKKVKLKKLKDRSTVLLQDQGIKDN